MPITATILDVAQTRPNQLALLGAFDQVLTYADLVEDSRTMFAAVDALHAEQEVPPNPAPETRGIPITAVSLTSAYETSRIIAGLAGFHSVAANIVRESSTRSA